MKRSRLVLSKLLSMALLVALMVTLVPAASATSLTAKYSSGDAGVSSDAVAEEADYVICGGCIYSDAEHQVEALAIKDGVVIYSGDLSGVDAYVGTDTEKLELADDETVIPGLVDAHSHAVSCWDAKLNAAQIPLGATKEECIEIITEFIEANPDREYYKANGWINSAFDNGCPTADLLDAIDTDKPIIATSSDGHSVWCNTAALELAGITAETEAPAGGTIETYEDGTPNGCLRDNASVLPLKALPAITAEDMIDTIMAAQEEYASIGYTAYNESMINDKSNLWSAPVLEAYEQLDQAGELLLYTQGAFIVSNRDDALDLVDEAIARRDATKGGDFEVTDIKIFMDGVVEGHTAYLQEEYADDPGYYGASSWTTDEDLDLLTQIVIKANEAGMTVHFHAIGDQASCNAVSVVERAYEELGQTVLDCRNVITHLQVVDDSTYEKMAELNMVANLNPWCCKAEGFFEETEAPMLGEERAENEYPMQSFLKAGVHCAFGTDYGSSFTYNPVDCFYTLVTRMDLSGDPSTVLKEEESLTPEEALSVMTEGGAYQLKKEAVFGTLDVGQQANLVILNQNMLAAEGTDILNTVVEKTMYNGVFTYEAA